MDCGFKIINDFFDASELDAIERAICKLYLMQAKKIRTYAKLVDELESNAELNSFEKLVQVYEALEEEDKEALYQVQKFLPNSSAIRKICSRELMKRCAEFLDVDVDSLLVDGPGLFINRPKTQRLLYKWHSEAHYYPKRRKFVNIWIPVFDDKCINNGTMSLKVGSHFGEYPFAEYVGFNKDSENKKNHFIQYEVPEEFIAHFETHHCEIQRGGMVIFDRNLIHRSNANHSDNYSLALVLRVWDPSNDLTLSGTLAATPYGGDIGRPDLVVTP